MSSLNNFLQREPECSRLPGSVRLRKITFQFSLLLALVFVLGLSQAQAGFLYVAVSGTRLHLYGFSVDETTGGLTLLPGFPMDTGGTAYVDG